MADSTISKDTVRIERTFDAPIDLIWKLWTQPEHFRNWYGPQGFTVPVAEMDVRVGGKRLLCMASPDGSMKMWLTGEYTEIVPNQRLVYTESPADEHGNIVPISVGTRNDYLLVTIITVQLQDLGGRTKMVMTHSGLPDGAQEAAAGWEMAIDKMAALIDAVLHKK